MVTEEELRGAAEVFGLRSVVTGEDYDDMGEEEIRRWFRDMGIGRLMLDFSQDHQIWLSVDRSDSWSSEPEPEFTASAYLDAWKDCKVARNKSESPLEAFIQTIYELKEGGRLDD